MLPADGTDSRYRCCATAAAINQLGNGALTDGDYGATGNFIDSRADTALGSAAAGYINLGRAYSEDAEAANDPGAAAATAVGNAVAGGITVVLADEGGAFVGE